LNKLTGLGMPETGVVDQIRQRVDLTHKPSLLVSNGHT